MKPERWRRRNKSESNQRLDTPRLRTCYLLALLIASSLGRVARSDELHKAARDPSSQFDASDPQSIEFNVQWSTDISQAKRQASDTGQPIMVVFR